MLPTRIIHGITVYYRPQTSDERVIKEVIELRSYQRTRLKFDVEGGERWLDLGANIGAFSIYCKIRGATAVAFEPDPGCFEILSRNVPEFERHQLAVTNIFAPKIPFYTAAQGLSGTMRSLALPSHTRYTAFPTPRCKPHGELPNIHASFLGQLGWFHGIKIDIEGGEFGILDDELLPACKKLCIEYHTSRDQSVPRLRQRLEYLKRKFKTVHYPPEYQRAMDSGAQTITTFFDRMIFCKDPIA